MEPTQEQIKKLRASVEILRKLGRPESSKALDDLLSAYEERGQELVQRREELACIDIWLRRREPVTRESATLRSVQEFMEQAERKLAEARAREAKMREALEEILDHVEEQNCDVIGAIQGARAALAASPAPAPSEEEARG